MFAANDKITHATMSFVVTLSFVAKHTFWHFGFSVDFCLIHVELL
jgi:hypothetical protein